MKIKNLMFAAATAVALAFTQQAHAVSFGFSSGANDLISFGGGNFSFTPAAPSNFVIDTGSATGLTGLINGSFAIGTVVGNSAPVTGNGTFTILDGATPLVAAVEWVDIAQFGSIGGLNTMLSVNLTSISYLGANADLLALANAGAGQANITYQFTAPFPTLAQLAAGASGSGTFSGSVSSVANVPDGGSTVALMGLALLGVAVVRSKFQLA